MTKYFLLPGVLLMLASSAAMADSATLKDTVPHITTTGRASSEVVPDQADLVLGVSNDRPSAQAAAEATAQSASLVIAEIKAKGIDPKDIRTSFDMSAQYDEEHDDKGRFVRRTLHGYTSEERITIRLRDVSKAGALARSFIEKGANEFQGIYFSFSREKETRKELKAAAIRDALAEAKIYTDAIGLRLGRALQIGDESAIGGDADLPARRPLTASAAVAIPTEPGMQVVEENISVIWEIEGKAL